jgi:hypothetical protein
MGWSPPQTHRQFVAWAAWRQVAWERPTLAEHYLMAVAAEVRRLGVKDPAKVEIKDLRLRFGTTATPQGLSQAPTPSILRDTTTAAAVSKGMWFGRLGLGKDGKRRPDVDIQQPEPAPPRDRTDTRPADL